MSGPAWGECGGKPRARPAPPGRAGTHAAARGAGRLLGFATTVAGMLVFALMIGVVSDYIGSKLDDLKKGKSKVIESGHTLILGWSEKGFPILHQLALANESEGGLPIVVLSEHDKEEMEERLRAAVSSKHNGLRLRGSRVVFRTGNPLAEHDLVRAARRGTGVRDWWRVTNFRPR